MSIKTFPYQRLYTSDEEIYQMFDNLKKYNVKNRLVSKPYTLKNVSIPSSELTFLGKPLLIIVGQNEYFLYRRLSDMFQEECRMQCKLFHQEQSPEEYFYSHTEEIHEYALKEYKKITPETVRESIYRLVRECTSHNPSHIMSMIQLFNSKSVLDFSAGWGDRLIGAMASDINFYCGVDPNPCLHPNYQEMIKFFGKSPKNFMMIQNTIEDAKLPDKKFDLIYTSPPYFDLEIYRKNNIQSSKYKEERDWFNNFFKVALNKVWKYLRDGGNMCININQKSKSEHYIKWMLEEVNSFEDSNYLGVISYSREDIGNPQPIWIWKKYILKVETDRLYIRRFKIQDIPQMAEIMKDKNNVKYIANSKIKTYNQTKNMIHKYINLAYTFYPIVLRDSNKVIGYLGYTNGVYLDKKYACMYFTRILIDSNQRGKGYGKEIYRAFLNYIGKIMYAMILPENTASIKLHQSVGFKFDKRIKFHEKLYDLYKWSPSN